MRYVIVINGKPCSGKDTVVDMVRDLLNGIAVVNVDSVGPVKEALKVLGWDGVSKSPQWRDLASHMKYQSDELFNTSYNHIADNIANYKYYDSVIFVHCREPKSIQQLVVDFNAKTLYVDRDVIVEATNTADNGTENHTYDFSIDNNGSLEDLRCKVAQFIEKNIKFKNDGRG